MISMERDVVDYPSKWEDAVYFSTTMCGLELERLRRIKDFYNTWSIVGDFKSKVGD
jgi:hypothetical protein